MTMFFRVMRIILFVVGSLFVLCFFLVLISHFSGIHDLAEDFFFFGFGPFDLRWLGGSGIFIPVVLAFMYFLSRWDLTSSERDKAESLQVNIADELSKLAEMRRDNLLTEEEFEQAKVSLLARY